MAQVGLDSLPRHEQSLGDLGVALALGRERCDAALRDGQLSDAGPMRIADSASGGAQLRASALGERVCAAAPSEVESLLERASRFRTAVATPKGGAEVDERAGMIQLGRGAREHLHGLA